MESPELQPSQRLSIGLTVAALVLLALFSPLVFNLRLAYLFLQFVVISIVIWQACDPFADAAQWVGNKLRLPGSVRGATLDAIASSMPELYAGIFFVVLATSSAETTTNTGDGFGSSLATCAGSAVYNMILIPAFCVLLISFYRTSRPTIDVEPEVISRDGMWFLGIEAVLIAFMFQDHMYWWMGTILLGLYAIYVLQLYRDAKTYQWAMQTIQEKFGTLTKNASADEIDQLLRSEGLRSSPVLVDQIRRSQKHQTDEVTSAGILYGLFRLPLTAATATSIILVATLIAGGSCYWLVEVARETAGELDVPIFFVAVILVAASSSVPDTFLSIGAAKRGDDSGAVSNAFGSNIFDICVSLSIPLLINSWMLGWEPVPLTVNGKPIAGLVDLRILLALFTGVTLLIMWHNRQLTRIKGFVLCGLYAAFIAYAVAGSMGFTLFQ